MKCQKIKNQAKKQKEKSETKREQEMSTPPTEPKPEPTTEPAAEQKLTSEPQNKEQVSEPGAESKPTTEEPKQETEQTNEPKPEQTDEQKSSAEENKSEPAIEQKPELSNEQKSELKQEQTPEPVTEQKPTTEEIKPESNQTPEPKPEQSEEQKSELKQEQTPGLVTEQKPTTEEIKPESNQTPESKSEQTEEQKSPTEETKSEPVTEQKSITEEIKPEPKPEQKEEPKPEITPETKQSSEPQESVTAGLGPKPTTQPPHPTPEEPEEEEQEENKAVRERIEDHNKAKTAVKKKLKETCAGILDEISKLETKISAELEKSFEAEEARQQELIKTKSSESADKPDEKVEYTNQKYVVKRNENAKKVEDMIRLKAKKIEINEPGEGSPIDILKGISEQHTANKEKSRKKLSKLCKELREEVKALKKQIKSDFEEEFSNEDERLKGLLKDKEISEEDLNVKLATGQIYRIEENEDSTSIKDKYTLVATKGIWKLEEMKIREFYIRDVKDGKVHLVLELFDPSTTELLKQNGTIDDVTVRVLMWKKGEKEETQAEYILDNEGLNSFSPHILKEKAIYCAQVRMEYEDQASEWSRVIEFASPKFSELCGWKKCPDNIEGWRQYIIDGDNSKIVKTRNDGGANDYSSAIIGNTVIPLNRTTSWNIKVSSYMLSLNGKNTYIGVAPFDIDQSNKKNFLRGGWHFYCFDSTLRSGPPQNYVKKEFGPRKKKGHYIRKNSAVGIIVDMTKREIAFALNYEYIGVAYEGIPIDKPLVPFAFAKEDQISFEFDFTEIKGIAEKESSVTVPANVSVAESTWGSISITWDNVDGASFYQIETIENGCCDGSASNKFTKVELRPETEYSFRVRAVRGNETSAWCEAVKGRTTATPALSEYAWSECPEGTIESRKYRRDESNSLVAIKNGTCDGYSAVITNIPLPSNIITSWNIKVLNSKDNNGRGIFIGVAPYDIYKCIDNEYKFTYNKCGWYFDCYNSTLRSGPPQFFCGEKKFGGIKDKKDGEYVQNGQTVGVAMDTKGGKLYFSLGGVNLGAGFRNIPLDKPLVPCVLIEAQGDSVELSFNSEASEQACIIS